MIHRTLLMLFLLALPCTFAQEEESEEPYDPWKSVVMTEALDGGGLKGDGVRKQAALDALAFVQLEHPDTPWEATAKMLKSSLHSFSLAPLQSGGAGSAGSGGGR